MLVFDNLDDVINIRLVILKQLNVNISFSNDCLIIFDFVSGKKQSVAKFNDNSPPKFITDEEYHNFKSYPSIPQKLYVDIDTWVPPKTTKYIKVKTD